VGLIIGLATMLAIPVFALAGKGRRGIYAALMALGLLGVLLFGFLFCGSAMVPPPDPQTDAITVEDQRDARGLLLSLAGYSLAVSLGGMFGTMLFRKSGPERPE